MYFILGGPTPKTCLIDVMIDECQMFCSLAGPYNLQGFLASNSTQKYFLIAHMISFFCDFGDKRAVFNISRQNVTIFDIGNG